MEEGKKEKLGEAGERGRESERKEREEGEGRNEGTRFNIHKLRIELCCHPPTLHLCVAKGSGIYGN